MTIYIKDIIWANQQTCTYHFYKWSTTNRLNALPRIKYLRADPVIDLLKQARDALAPLKNRREVYADCKNGLAAFIAVEDTIDAINKFLEETK